MRNCCPRDAVAGYSTQILNNAKRAAAGRRLTRASRQHEVGCAYGSHAPEFLEPIKLTRHTISQPLAAIDRRSIRKPGLLGGFEPTKHGVVPDRAKWQHWCSRQPNAITLSCKGRPPCRPLVAARRLPRLTRSGRSEVAADVTRACSWSRPRRLRRRARARRPLSACEDRCAGRAPRAD